MAQRYDASTGKWVYVADNPSDSATDRRPTAGSSNTSQTPPPDLTDTSNKDTTTSTNNATKEYIDVEQNILVGDLRVLPDPKRKAKHTVLLQYLGKNLTGLYFVDSVTHSFSNAGYEQTLSVSRNGFGDTIKSGNAGRPVTSIVPSQGGLMNGSGNSGQPSTSTRPAEVTPPKTNPPVATRTYTIVKGDTLWGIATKFYGNGSQYTKIYNANKSIIKNANLIYPGQKIVIP